MIDTLPPFDMGCSTVMKPARSQVLAEGDSDELIRAVGHVAKARGMAQIVKDSGLGRASLYQALAPGAKPRFDTILKVMRAMGMELQAKTAPHL